MFRLKHRVGDNRLDPVFGRKSNNQRLATPIAVRTQATFWKKVAYRILTGQSPKIPK
ncbi:MAG: hypothetical protein LBF88_10355 [Planctomycetaceae bacterium]|jgi:hypothetical protein|nr:hypothetical protein [Planctomycetaceae bacterium]